MLALGGISIYTHYFSAMSAATLVYDRTLLASARTVAERLVVREGKLAVDVPYVVLDSFERNMNDQLYYEVISPQGKSISGYDDLPSLPPHIPRPRSTRRWCILRCGNTSAGRSAWRRCFNRSTSRG